MILRFLRHMTTTTANRGVVAALLLTTASLAVMPAQAQVVQRSIINPDFEQPPLMTNGCRVYIAESQVPGWRTSHPAQRTENSGGCAVPAGFNQIAPIIEIWKTPRSNSSGGTVNSSSGTQLAELNAALPSRLYQNVCLVRGESFNWRFNHRGRASSTLPDSARFVLGLNQNIVTVGTTNTGARNTPIVGPGASAVTAVNQAGNTTWVNYGGNYVYNGPSGATSLGFEAVSTGTGDQTSGNFLDNVQINLLPFIELVASSSSGLESTSTAVPRLRIVGTVNAPFSLQVNITGGTATLGVDYLTPGNSTVMTINVPAGVYDGVSPSSFRTLPITVVNDALSEQSETIQYTIQPPGGAPFMLSSTTSCGGTAITSGQYTIIDDDAALSVSKNLDSITPVSGSPGQYNVQYSVSVTNPSGATASYGLTDQPGFDPDAVIQSATVSLNGAAATTVNTGASPWVLQATGRNLVGGATDTYLLNVRINIARPGTTTNDTCAGGPGSGLYNTVTATLQSPATTFSDRTCATTPTPSWVTLTKQLQQRIATDQITIRTYVGGLVAASASTTGTANPTMVSTPTLTIEPGRTVQFEESVKAFGTAADTPPSAYSRSLVCVNNASGSTTVLPTGEGTLDTTSAYWDAFTPSPGDDLTCTIVNSSSQQLRLAKTWVGGLTGDTISVTTTGGSQNATLTSSAPTDSTGSYVSVLAGETITLPVETGTNIAEFDQRVTCTGGSTLASTTLPATLTISSSSTPTTCTYTNTRHPAVVSLRKVSNGDVGTFDFTMTGLDKTAESITTTVSGTEVSATGTPYRGTTGVAATITETAASAAGFAMSYVCTDNNASITGNSAVTGTGTTITLSPANMSPGAAWSCIVTNNKLSTITVSKISYGGTGTFNFSGDNGVPVHSIATTQAGVATVGPVQTLTTAGAVTRLTETNLPAGFTLTDIACSRLGAGGTATATINGAAGGFVDLDAAATAGGADISCTFTNSRMATVEFRKAKIGNDSTPVNVTFVPTANSNLNTPPSSITSDTNDNVPGPASTVQSVQQLNAPVNVTEQLLAGYHLGSAVCEDTNGLVSGNGAGPQSVTVNGSTGLVTIPAGMVRAGAALSCTLTNIKNASITIVEDTRPNNTQSFLYSSTGNGLTNFALDDDGNAFNTLPNVKQFLDLAPGAYSVTQNTVPGYSTELTCVGDVAGGTATTVSGTTANLNLDAGESLTCTFVNTQLPTLTILKKSLGGTGTFTFGGDNGVGATGVTTDTPNVSKAAPLITLTAAETITTITEGALPAGWSLANITCSGMGAGGTATPTLLSRQVVLDEAATAPGSNIQCEFTNSKDPILRLSKRPMDMAGVFDFDITGAGIPSTSILANTPNVPTGGQIIAGVQAGVPVTIAETNSSVPTSFLSDITCVNAVGSVPAANLGAATYVGRFGEQTVTLNPGSDVMCTFTNSQQGSLAIQKTTVGGNGTFGFDLAVADPNDISATHVDVTTLNGVGSGAVTLSNTAPITVTVTEAANAAFQLTDIQCSPSLAQVPSGANGVQLTAAVGASGSCNFTNIRKPNITVAKRTVGGVGTVTLGTGDNGLEALNGQSITTVSAGTAVNHPTPVTVTSVLVPTHITETFPVGESWDSTWQCQDVGGDIHDAGTGTTIMVSPATLQQGEDLTCTFTNTRAPKLKVTKQVLGGSGQVFNFAVSGGGLGAADNFTLAPATDGGTDTRDIVGLLPNQSLTINEGPNTITGFLPDWQLLNLQCVDNPGGVTGSSLVGATPSTAALRNGGSISGSLVAGADVTCTFVNARTVTGTVKKQTLGGNETFNYGLWVNPGTPAGPANLVVPVTTTGATATTPGNGSFTQEFPSSGTGAFRIQETLKNGWQLTQMGCSLTSPTGALTETGRDLATGTLDYNVSAGATLDCEFTNVRVPNVRIAKVTIGDAGSFNFSGGSNGLPSALNLTTTASGVAVTSTPFQVADVTAPASISETVAAGWTLDSVVCRRDSDNVTVTTTLNGGELTIPSAVLAEGNDLTCTFTNSKQTKLTVIKDARGDAASFPFELVVNGGTPQPFALATATAYGTATQVFNNIAANQPVVIRELTAGMPAAWALVDAVCVDNAGSTSGSTLVGAPRIPANAQLQGGRVEGQLVPGADVTCTFTNNQNATGSIVKTAVGGDDTFNYNLHINVTTPVGPVAGAFVVTTAGGTGTSGNQSFPVLSTGNFVAMEVAKPGWQLTAANCQQVGTVGQLSNVVVDLNGRYVSGHVEPGTSAQCSFTNVRIPTITLQETSRGGTGSFTYTGGTNGLPASETLTTAAPSTPVNSAPYTVADVTTDATLQHIVPGGWALESVICRANGIDVGASWLNGTLTVPNAKLQEGNDITCTFTHVRQATLTVIKTVRNNNGGSATVTDFNVRSTAGALTFGPGAVAGTDTTYTSTTLVVAPGTYALLEDSVLNYLNGTWSCTGATVNNDQSYAGEVVLAEGAVAVCSILNDDSNAADIRIAKVRTSAGPVVRGQTVEYQVTVDNRGPALGNGAIVRDTPGSELEQCAITSCTGTNGAMCPATPAAILQPAGAAIPTLPVGGQVQFTVQCKAR